MSSTPSTALDVGATDGTPAYQYDDTFDKDAIEKAVTALAEELGVTAEEIEYNWGPSKNRKTYEYVYHLNVRPGIAIRIFSSVDKRDNDGRNCGSDAIRTQLVLTRTDDILATKPHTKRIQTWFKNLRTKVLDLANVSDQMRECPNCGGYLRYIRGHDFYGCSNYNPDDGCTYSESV